MDDIEEIIPAADVVRRRREIWEAEQLAALADRRAKKQPITDLDVELRYERLLIAAAPLVNERAAEVRARQERIKTRKPRSIAPPPLAPRVIEPPAPPRKKAAPKAPAPSRPLGDGPAAVVHRAPSPPASSPAVKTPPAPELVAPPPARKVAKRQSVWERQAAAGAQRRARVVELTTAGKTGRQIARAMGLSLESVRNHQRAAGVEPEPAKVEKGSAADWPALYREGRTIQQIAQLSGWSTTHVRQALLKAAVEMRVCGNKEMSALAAMRAAATDISHISTDVRATLCKLADDGVPVRILASTYAYKHAEVRAVLLGAQLPEASC